MSLGWLGLPGLANCRGAISVGHHGLYNESSGPRRVVERSLDKFNEHERLPS